MKKSKIFHSTYRDSVLLMKMATSLRREKGVENAEVMMASDSNKSILRGAGLMTDDIEKCVSSDLVISVVADSEETLDRVIMMAEELITSGNSSNGYATLESALNAHDNANLALISIPGEYAANEAEKALKAGLNVMIFSDNVSVEDEIKLKKIATERELLVMGPDCGTAMINGAALAFCNSVRRGKIGLVGAAGTGLQEAMVLLHKNGLGVSQAIGTGSNDIKEVVGGVTILRGIDMLSADVDSEIIMIIAKPTAKSVEEKIVSRLHACKKPAVLCLLGDGSRGCDENIHFAETIEKAVITVVKLAGGKAADYSIGSGLQAKVDELSKKLKPTQKNIRALYTGGTLASEACIIMSPGRKLQSNIKIGCADLMESPLAACGNAVIDLGDDIFTKGKPHPMIEPLMRADRIVVEAADETVGVILMDFVLGFGTHANPVGCTLPYIEEAKRIAAQSGREIAFVAYVLGTDMDKQDIEEQRRLLEENGVITAESNAQAARLAAQICGG